MSREVGGVPAGWQDAVLGDLLTEIQGGFSVNGSDSPANEGKPGVLKLNCVLDGSFRPEQNKSVNESDLHLLSVYPKADSVIISRANTKELVGMCGYVDQDFPTLFLPDLLWLLRGDPEKVTMRWLSNWLSSPHGRQKVSALAAGSNASMVKINKEGFKKLYLLLPPLPEQRKIAAILSTWDDSLATLTNLLAAKHQQKRGLAEALLTGKKRLPGFEGEWEEVELSRIIKESRIPADDELGKRLTVSLHLRGVSVRDERDNSEVGKTIYYRRKAGQFIYGKQNIFRGSMGIVPDKLDGYLSSQDLPAFDVASGFSVHYLYEYFARGSFYKELEKIATGTGSKRVHPETLYKLQIPSPPLPEQQAIASILSTLDAEIASLEALKAKVLEQKRGLMDELLTGRVRVKVNDA